MKLTNKFNGLLLLLNRIGEFWDNLAQGVLLINFELFLIDMQYSALLLIGSMKMVILCYFSSFCYFFICIFFFLMQIC